LLQDLKDGHAHLLELLNQIKEYAADRDQRIGRLNAFKDALEQHDQDVDGPLFRLLPR
jgi:hypothetical protein